jgi:hypothetical protein
MHEDQRRKVKTKESVDEVLVIMNVTKRVQVDQIKHVSGPCGSTGRNDGKGPLGTRRKTLPDRGAGQKHRDTNRTNKLFHEGCRKSIWIQPRIDDKQAVRPSRVAETDQDG